MAKKEIYSPAPPVFYSPPSSVAALCQTHLSLRKWVGLIFFLAAQKMGGRSLCRWREREKKWVERENKFSMYWQKLSGRNRDETARSRLPQGTEKRGGPKITRIADVVKEKSAKNPSPFLCYLGQHLSLNPSRRFYPPFVSRRREEEGQSLLSFFLAWKVVDCG